MISTEYLMKKDTIMKVLKNWNIAEVSSFRKATKGVVNHNYIVQTKNGKFILRNVRKDKREKDLIFELKYLEYLEKNNFQYKIPSPIKTVNGDFFVKTVGGIFWLYSYINGNLVKKFNKEHLKEIAKMMAGYHHLIEQSNLDNSTHYSPFSKTEIIDELNAFSKDIFRKNKVSKEDDNFLEASKKLIKIFNKLNSEDYSKLARFPLHRDINPENTLWNKGKLVGVIDFENVSEIKDTIIKDIAGMLQYSCRDKNARHKTDLELARFFIKEYRKYHTLLDEEIAFIPDVITAGAIEDFCYSYWMLLNDKKRAKVYRLKLYSRVAQWHFENKDKIIKELLG